MTDTPCSQWCPFASCDGCPYQGGSGLATTVFGAKCETIGVRKTAPEQCANTAEGLTTQTSEESKWL